MEKAETWRGVSRGWFALFLGIYWVLLVFGAVSLGMMLTVGSPKHMKSAIGQQASVTAITKTLNQTLVNGLRDEKVTIKSNAQVVHPKDVKAMITATPIRSDGTIATIDRMSLNRTIVSQIQADTQQADKTLTVQQTQALAKTVDGVTKRVIGTEFLNNNWGTAYPFLVLVTQTGVIVSLILIVIVWGFLLATAHSLRRFFVSIGRSTYIIGFLGGAAAMLAATIPAIEAVSRIRILPQATFAAIITSSTITWQRVAGWTVVVGLGLALVSYLFRQKPKV